MLKPRQRLGKYRVERKLGRGGFAEVWRAHDTIEDRPVALKIPHPELVSPTTIENFRKEIGIIARLDHPCILPLKTADMIHDHFVIVTPLATESLADRLKRRLSTDKAILYVRQMLAGLAYAHRNQVMHCDIKPDNFLIFSDDRVRLTDFGIARVAQRTIKASGSGTVGYLAPEQALGKPSFRSDVFSLGLVFHEMLTGKVPEWPFEWPTEGHARLKAKLPSPMLQWLRKALEVDTRKRFVDAQQMRTAFERLGPSVRRKPQKRAKPPQKEKSGTRWKKVRHQEFKRAFAKTFELDGICPKCKGPVGHPMHHCPWCGHGLKKWKVETRFPAQCTRCGRGMKHDWKYCPWCYGAGFEPHDNRTYTDKRYEARCANPRCPDGRLMRWMRYCPWCRTKVRRKWKAPGTAAKCPSCEWGVLPEYWEHCPWCGKSLKTKKTSRD